MTADARERQVAFGHLGRGVVRAARAVISRARRRADAIERLLLGFEKGQALLDALADVKALDALRDHAGDLRDRQVGLGGQKPFSARVHPLAFLVELADHARAHVAAPVVQVFLQLVFDDLALFLDHQHFVEAFGELAHAVGLQRPGHRHLENANADVRREVRVYAQLLQGLAHVEVGLARGDDPQARVGRVDHRVVEPVGARVG